MHAKEFPWAQYKPKDGILVVQPVWITEREIQFLMQLYAPFIGKEATLLYATLYGELSPSEYESEVFSISELLLMTNLGMPDFYLAKLVWKGLGYSKRIVRSQLLHALKRTRWNYKPQRLRVFSSKMPCFRHYC